MSAAHHWTADWIGRPWVAGESDCWSLARAIWAERWGREVAPLPVDPRDLRASAAALAAGAGDWLPADPPAEGDAVLMGRRDRPCHVGVWIAPDRVLHSVERSGVICTPAGRLDALGYRVIAILRHPSWGPP